MITGNSRGIIIVVLLALSIACAMPRLTGSAITGKPLQAATTRPTQSPPITPTPKIVQVIGSWNLRAGPRADAAHVAFVDNEEVTIILSRAWLFVRTQDGILGWINPRAIEQKDTVDG